MNTQNNRKNWHIASICLAVIMLGILFYSFTANISAIVAFAGRVNQVLRPIYYGTILAFLLSPAHKFFYGKLDKYLKIQNPKRKESLCNGLAIFFSLSMALILVYLLLAMVLPEIYLSIEGLFLSIPQDFSLSTPEWLAEFFEENPDLYNNIAPYYEGTIASINNWYHSEVAPRLNNVDDLMSFAQNTLLPNLSDVVTGVSQFIYAIISFLLDLVVAIIVSVYLLARKKTFAAQSKKLVYAFFPVTWGDFILQEARNAYRILSGFITGKLIDSVLIGIICFIGCTLLQMPYAILIATIIGLTNIIPFFGPFIGAIPCGILIFLVSPVKCLYFIGFIIALQQFDGNILGPKILGESTGLASFWVLFAIILFGGIFGVAGMIFGVPVFATFYSMMSRLTKHLLKKKNMPYHTKEYEAYWETFYDTVPEIPEES